jgi:hypothetical protein
MKRVLASVGAGAAGTVLAACGSSSSAAIDPAASSEPDVSGTPVWTCQDHVGQFIDYAAGAPGKKTRAAALASYRNEGDHVVRTPHHDHQLPRVLLVDDHDVIQVSLELWHTRRGWLVTSIERCAD